METLTHKRCSRCHEIKPVTDFYKCSKSRSGFNWSCKPCDNAANKRSPNRRISLKRYYQKWSKKPENKAKMCLAAARKSDRKHNRSFNLMLSNVKDILLMGCSYCGATDPLQMTLDRIDCTEGHTVTNTVAACIRCQFIRRDMPVEAFRLLTPGIRKAMELGLFRDWTGLPRRW